MKILLVGEWFSSNLGDGVLCQTVSNYLEQNLEGIEFIPFDISLRNGFKTISADKASLNLKDMLKKFIETILNNKVLKRRIYNIYFKNTAKNYINELETVINNQKPSTILFCGGQMFMDFFLYKLEYTISLAEKKNIPVIFNACGLGNNLTAKDIRRCNAVINNKIVKYISLRDHAELLKNDKVISTFDTAIILKDYFRINKMGKMVGLGIMYVKSASKKEQILFWSGIIQQFISSKNLFKVFTNGNEDDYCFAKEVLSYCGLKNDDYLEDRPLNPEQLISQISRFCSIVSMRLHSLLIAYSLGIRCIAFSWDSKVRYFFQKAGLEDYCFNMNDSQIDVIEMIDKAKNDYSYFKSKEFMQNEINQNLKTVCALISEQITKE